MRALLGSLAARAQTGSKRSATAHWDADQLQRRPQDALLSRAAAPRFSPGSAPVGGRPEFPIGIENPLAGTAESLAACAVKLVGRNLIIRLLNPRTAVGRFCGSAFIQSAERI